MVKIGVMPFPRIAPRALHCSLVLLTRKGWRPLVIFDPLLTRVINAALPAHSLPLLCSGVEISSQNYRCSLLLRLLNDP